MPYISQINGINFSASHAATASYAEVALIANTSSYVNLAPSQSLSSDGTTINLDGGGSGGITLTAKNIIISGNSSIDINSPSTTFQGNVTLPIAFYNITASRANTSSLAATASYALTASLSATASFLQNNDPLGLTISVTKGITLQATDVSTSTINLQAKNITFSGSVGSTTITSYGNILPGGPYTNNTSSFNLGSPTAAWKDIYVSNGSINFISGSVSSSIQFNNGEITFPGATITIPTGSTVPTASFAQTASFLLGLATSASYSNTASFAQNVYAPSFITYSGGNQTSSTTTLADVHSSAGWDNINIGFYEFEIFVVYNSSGTTVGSKFSISGSTSYDYLSCDVGYSTIVTDRAAYMFRIFDAGTASPSSQLITGNAAVLQGHINITSTGQLRLRFASEVASPSNITVTDVNGYLRRLY